MNFKNLLKIAIRALVRNKLRAFLTMLGIIIGVASVIAMLAIGEGSKKNIQDQMSSMGTNLIMIMPNMQQRGGVSLGASSSVVLKMTDVEALRNEATALSEVSPQISASGQVIYGNQNTQTSVYGVTEEYLSIRKLTIENGRIFNSNEVRSMSKVCILGQTVVENLFGEGSDPVARHSQPVAGQCVRRGKVSARRWRRFRPQGGTWPVRRSDSAPVGGRRIS